MIQIIPALLTNNTQELLDKLSSLEGIVDRVHIDIIDGVFADNKTILPDILETVDTNLTIDFHLMTKEPIDWVEGCVRGMADRIFGHIEQMSSQADFIGKVQAVGCKVALAVDLTTPIASLDSSLLTSIDAILVMSVPSGFGGQDFDERVLEKIKKLDKMRLRDDTPFRICVDGGINEETIARVVGVGADEVAIGAHLFQESVAEHLKRLQGASVGRR